jgi:hypothetical protein
MEVRFTELFGSVMSIVNGCSPVRSLVAAEK